jgi:Arc/MetJ family transcription regulator
MTRKHRKNFRVDAAEVRRVQRLLHVETEREAIERALDFVISEYRRNELALAANDELLATGIAIRDVYGS